MYYPKSQIVPNLYTNGEEYVYAVNSKEYIGHYFATADGKFLDRFEMLDRIDAQFDHDAGGIGVWPGAGGVE